MSSDTLMCSGVATPKRKDDCAPRQCRQHAFYRDERGIGWCFFHNPRSPKKGGGQRYTNAEITGTQANAYEALSLVRSCATAAFILP